MTQQALHTLIIEGHPAPTATAPSTDGRRRGALPRLRVVLTRDEQSDMGTFGRFAVPGLDAPIECAEPPGRRNAVGRSCIPAGRYRCRWQRSPKYGMCYEVTGVPGRTRILIHSGNVAGDRDLGLHTHTLGCLLPGSRRGWLTVRGRRQRAVLASRSALRRLEAAMGRQPFTLEIRDA